MSLRVVERLSSIDPAEWDALHDGRNPFVTHAFLSGLERSGSLRAEWGWRPAHALLSQQGRLIAAAPMYLKDNSHGEFVFDHAWARAYAGHGLDYYPKWLGAVPYSPVTGPRLLARDADARSALLHALQAHAHEAGLPSLHLNFLMPAEADAVPQTWLARCDVQFHWRNPGWRDFADFLDAFVHKRRKAIRQERERTRRSGHGFRIVHGDEASAADLDAMHAFYGITFAEKGNPPALTRAFFDHLAQAMPRALVLILAEREGRTVAGALCLRGGDTLYGRYWGCSEAATALHFETCYYQGIDYCLREGLRRFEPGAQGEHKLARGFLPELTHSRHWVADARFAAALRDWCAQERAAAQRYRDLLLQHSPFRHDDHPAAPA